MATSELTHRDDWRRLQIRIGLDLTGSVVAIHHRHLNIHEDQIGVLRLRLQQRRPGRPRPRSATNRDE